MIERVLAALVPEHDRDAVLGDLYEEIPPGGARTTVRRLFAIVGIALRYEIEPYVRGADIREAVGVLAAGLGLMWAAGAAGASWAGAEIPGGYDPVSRALLALWVSPYALGLLSALTAGLIAGRMGRPDRPGSLEGAPRRHVAIALTALALLSSPTLVAGVAAASLCLMGAWFGAAARREAEPTRARALR